MNKLDKKQMPQFAALCVLSAGAFGYFVMKIVTPSPAAAGTRPHPVAEAASAAHSSVKTAAGTGVAPAEEEAEAPAPTPGMRDPFVVGDAAPKTPPVQTGGAALPALPGLPGLPAAHMPKPTKVGVPQLASIHEVSPAPIGVPAAPALPFGLKGFSPVSAASAPRVVPPKATVLDAPAAPTWTVTGVLQNDLGQVAVLRNGEARRIVRTGDFVDNVYRVVAVTRSTVTLRHGKTFYHLTLGAAKPAAPASVMPIPFAAPSPAPKPTSEDQAARLPARPVPPQPVPVQVVQSALLLAHSYLAPAQLRVESCLLSFRAQPSGTPWVSAYAFNRWMPALVTEDAQNPLELSRDMYAVGQTAESHTPWQCALTTHDLEAGSEAATLFARDN